MEQLPVAVHVIEIHLPYEVLEGRRIKKNCFQKIHIIPFTAFILFSCFICYVIVSSVTRFK